MQQIQQLTGDVYIGSFELPGLAISLCKRTSPHQKHVSLYLRLFAFSPNKFTVLKPNSEAQITLFIFPTSGLK